MGVTDTAEAGEVQDMENYLLWGEARKLSHTVKEKATSKFKEKAGVRMDTDVGEEMLQKAHVLVDKKTSTVYSETLSSTDIISGTNSFYILYLLESDEYKGDAEYWVFRKWGRLGASQ